MGKGNRHKRKKGSSSSGSDNSELLSSVLGEANGVLFNDIGSPSYALPTGNTGDTRSTSTPKGMSVNNGTLQQIPTESCVNVPTPVHLSQAVSAPPAWATDIMNTIQLLNVKVCEISKKLEKLESVELKVVKFETNLEKIEKDLSSVQASISDGLKVLHERAENMEFRFGELSDRMKTLESDNKDLKSEIVDVKARSMRDNLLFSNIPEKPNETPEITEAVLREFMNTDLKMDVEQIRAIKFDRVHRIAGRNQPRVIVAKFKDFKERQDVKSRSKTLRGTNFYINEQFPPEINAQRKELKQVMKEKRNQGHKTNLVYNKLYIDNVLYKGPSSRERRP